MPMMADRSSSTRGFSLHHGPALCGSAARALSLPLCSAGLRERVERGLDTVAGHVAAQQPLYLRAGHPAGARGDRGVKLFGEPVAQLRGHIGCGASAARCLLDPARSPAGLAVAPASARQRSAALAAHRRMGRLDGRLTRLSGREAMVERRTMMRPRQRRPAWHTGSRVLGERINSPLDHGRDLRPPHFARAGELLANLCVIRHEPWRVSTNSRGESIR